MVLKSTWNTSNKRFFSSARALRNQVPPTKPTLPPSPQVVYTKAPVAGTPSPVKRFFKIAFSTTLVAALASAAYIGYKVYEESHPPASQVQHSASFVNGQKKKTIVILGSGWGSISLLKNLDTTLYNVIIVSPRNYFLFTPLLPSCPTGTVELRSIIEPVRSIARRSAGEVTYYEAEATDIDPINKKITVKQSTIVHSGVSGKDSNSTQATVSSKEDLVNDISYDYLIVGVGAQPSTFGTPGVAEHSCFLKELSDSSKIRRSIMDNIEAAGLLAKGSEERKRLLSMVVVGGGPTGVEFAGELQDYIDQDLRKWMPDIADEIKVTVIEAMPNVLSMFNKKLVDYTQEVFKETNIDLKTSTMVKKVDDYTVFATTKEKDGSNTTIEVPYGVLIWATGNAPREIVKTLSSKIDEQKTARRGLLINDNLLVNGTNSIFGLGDCTFTKNAPTAQVAHQQGIYLGQLFTKLHKIDTLEYEIAQENEPTVKEKLGSKLANAKVLPNFIYKHQGALAYIGSEKAVADLVWGDWSNVSSGGSWTFLVWRSAYIYMCLSVKNQILVSLDWLKVSMFGRDCSKE